MSSETLAKTVKRKPRVKIAPNLFKIGDVYYYRKGDFEERLGQFKSDKLAIEAKEVFEALRSRVGTAAFKFKVKDLWPSYVHERREQREGLIEGRRRISERTFHEIELIWDKHLKHFFANKRLAEIDAVLWNAYCKRTKVADLANHRKVFGTFLRWCADGGHMTFIPVMRIPAVVRRKRKRVPEAHVLLMIEHSSGGLLLFILQYLYMLMRRSEQARERWDQMSLEEGWVLIPDEHTRTRTGRVIPMNALVKELLKARREEQITSGLVTPWVFPRRGRPEEPITESGFSKAWTTMIKRAGLKTYGYEPHDLRATGEHFTNKDTNFTDTQMEKFAGASIKTQRRIYLQGYLADDLRGLEEAVRIPGAEQIVSEKLRKIELDIGMGKSRESKRGDDDV